LFFGARHIAAFIFGGAILLFAATTALRLYYMYCGYRSGTGRDAPWEPVPTASLPEYTIMVALYREAAVVPALLDALGPAYAA